MTQENAGGSDGGKPPQQQQQQHQTPSKKKMTKAERRALQEQQRAAKAARQAAGGGGGGKGGGQQQQQQQQQQKQKQQQQQQQQQQSSSNKQSADKTGDKKETSQKSKADMNTVATFSHLPQYRDPADLFVTGPALVPRTASSDSNLHPAVLELGYHYASGRIRGGNARCRAMFQVYEKILQDFIPATTDDARNDLRQQIDHQVLKPAFTYWTTNCRPHSVSMGNAFTFLKAAVASLDRDLSIVEMKKMLQQTIEAYVRERIVFAQRAIAQQQVQSFTTHSNHATLTSTKSNNTSSSQVFLTYGHSEAIEVLLLQLKESGNNFRVIVVDSRPLLEGKRLLVKLRQADIDCSYILLNAISYVMKDVQKVYLGASALMSDGSVLGRVGTACVALAAQAHHIPVLVCCESYKISNRVQLESITGNELGDPNNVASTDNNEKENMMMMNHQDNNKEAEDGGGGGLLDKWKEIDNLRLLNLLYDLTPSEFVSGIVTELGIIPPTSVAVLLREMNNPQD